MKRKEITETIAKVGAGTFALNGSMSLINPKTGEGFDVDMSATLAIVRGTLAWVDTLLEDGAKPEPSTVKHMQKLLTYVGSSIAYDISSDEEEWRAGNLAARFRRTAHARPRIMRVRKHAASRQDVLHVRWARRLDELPRSRALRMGRMAPAGRARRDLRRGRRRR